MNIDAVRGDKVIFTGDNVGDYSREMALKVFKIGEIYEVEYITKATFSNFVKIKGISKEYNSVMFESI